MRTNTILALAAACVLLLTTISAAQEYVSDEVDRRVQSYAGHVRTSAESAVEYAQNKDNCEQFFNRYFFPMMTQYATPEALANLQTGRENLFRTYLKPEATPEFRRDVTEWTSQYMKKIVLGNYDPAVKYNAVLIWGMLDEGIRGGTPIPHTTANKALIVIIGTGLQGDARFPTSMVVGALAGLERHARFRQGWNPETSQERIPAMAAAAMAVLNTESAALRAEPPDVQSWVKSQAAAVLAELANPGENNTVHQALMHLVGDSSLVLDDRTLVAEMLGKMNYQQAQGIDTLADAKILADLAVEVANHEDEKAKELQDLWRTSSSSFSAELPKFGRERLLARLDQLLTGFAALRNVPDFSPDAQAQVGAVTGAIDPVLSLAKDPNSPDLELASRVRTMADGIRRAAALAPRPATASAGSAATNLE